MHFENNEFDKFVGFPIIYFGIFIEATFVNIYI